MLLAIGQAANAQSPQPPKVIPPGPEVGSLEKYLEQPMSLSAGLPVISIPIHTLSEGDISVPVSLSYHAGGIRVEQVASTVGLGWDLMAGGMITRTIKGRPDDSPGGYMYTQYSVLEARMATYTTQSYLEWPEYQYRDYQPDDFTFNFSGYQGNIFYDKENQKFIQGPFSNLKVTPDYDSAGLIVSWTVVDDRGTSYYFGKTPDSPSRTAVERQAEAYNVNYNTNSGSSGNTSPQTNFISTWYLVKIVSLKGDAVDFHYGESESYRDVFKISESLLRVENSGVGNCYSYNVSIPNSVDYSTRLLKHTFLTKIASNTQEILFEQDTQERLDLPKSKALKSITVKHGAEEVKKFNLDHDYFVSGDTYYRWHVGNPATASYRLRLKKVYQSNGSESLPGYEFTYNPTMLPNKTSFSQDAWGYFNGKNNTTLIPLMDSPITQIPIGNANRSADEEKSKACILEKIKYPTGGTTEYFYELHRPGIVINKDMPALFNQETYKQSGLLPSGAGQLDPQGNPVPLASTYTNQFTVARVTRFKAVIWVDGCTGPSINNTACHYTFSIISSNGQVTTLYNTETSIVLPDGTYTIKAQKQGNAASSQGFTVALYWYEKDLEEKTGGLRIKKIISSESEGSPSLVREFSYAKFGTSLSSGYCMNYPVFLERDYLVQCPNSFKILSVNQDASLSSGPSKVWYENVTEYQRGTDDSAANGKTEYIYDISYLPSISIADRTMGIDTNKKSVDWRSGTLLEKKTYRGKGTSEQPYQLIEKTKNEYEIFGERVITDFGAKFEPRDLYYGSQTFEPNQYYKYIFYSASTEWYRPTTSTKTEYFPSGDLVTTSVNNYADNPLLASSITRNSSLGDVLESRFFYPKPGFTASSLPNGNITAAQASAVNTMAQQNNISTPIQVQEYQNSELLSTQRTLFKDWDPGTAKMILPEIVQASKGANALENRVRYTRVDPANGNPLEVQQENGMKTCYIWGYDKKLPVAKIENIAYASIPASLITDIQAASDATAYSETVMLQQLDALRAHASLAGAMVSTFTHRPLVGMATATDPKGDRTTYEYDAFNRLKAVRDKDGNLLSENEYHYKNQ